MAGSLTVCACRFHESKAIEAIRKQYAGDISRFIAMQYLFDRQWKELKASAGCSSMLHHKHATHVHCMLLGAPDPPLQDCMS